MDFSGLFSGQEGKKNFEDAVSPQSEDLMSKVLPLLAGGKMDSNALFKILANNNPKLSGLMQLMPLLSNGLGSSAKKTSAKKTYEYVKICDYYKNK